MQTIRLPFKIKKPVLALGAQTKNTLCFGSGDYAYFSRVHPDLTNPSDLLSFQKSVKYFLKKKPEIIAYDLHPEYQPTKYISELSQGHKVPAAGGSAFGGTMLPVQHHHAHIASCMAENKLKNQKVIGVAFDGTGLGSDNNLWGAEFLICNYKDFKRGAHLKEIPLLGGEKAILEPWRLAYAWGFRNKKNQILEKMRAAGFNCPLASSMGRLFDAVGCLVLGKAKANFEAELAIELEELAKRYTLNAIRYNFRIIRCKDGHIIDPIPIFKEIIADLKAKEPKEKIAYRFHLTVAEMIRRTCLVLRRTTRINKVVLSGGVFQNNLLLRLALDLLYKEDFKVFAHRYLSCNDSGISLGQVAIANSRS